MSEAGRFTLTMRGPRFRVWRFVMKIGLPNLLFLVFLVLKLTGKIDWSWWWITCPLWAGIAILALIAVLFGGLVGVLKLIK